MSTPPSIERLHLDADQTELFEALEIPVPEVLTAECLKELVAKASAEVAANYHLLFSPRIEARLAEVLEMVQPRH